jgi:hypothetical protein
MAQAFDQRQREQDEPRESAQDQPEHNGIRSAADQAQPAAQPVQRSPEQGEILKSFALFHGLLIVTYGSRTRFGRMTPQVELPFYGCLAADEPCVPDRPCCGIDSDQVPGASEAFI